MRRLVVNEFLSLDGVMQGPGGPEEDTEGGFKLGGWALPYHSDDYVEKALEEMAQTEIQLFGRKTYEEFASYWPTAPTEIPFTAHLNSVRKVVASNTLQRVDWNNSTLIRGDVAEEVAKLKAEAGGNISVLGSGNLVQTLMENDLVDEYSLVVYPIVLGSGKRFFRSAEQVMRLTLIDSTPTSTGGVILRYRPAEGSAR